MTDLGSLKISDLVSNDNSFSLNTWRPLQYSYISVLSQRITGSAVEREKEGQVGGAAGLTAHCYTTTTTNLLFTGNALCHLGVGDLIRSQMTF